MRTSALIKPVRYIKCKNEEELLKLPGVGPDAARATAMAMSWESRPCIDSVSVRVIRRFLGKMALILPDDQVAEVFYSRVPKDKWGTINWAVLDLAAAICMPQVPRCSNCPIADDCKSGQQS